MRYIGCCDANGALEVCNGAGCVGGVDGFDSSSTELRQQQVPHLGVNLALIPSARDDGNRTISSVLVAFIFWRHLE